MTINCLLIDDNDFDRAIIEGYIQECHNLRMIGSFSNPLESMEVLQIGNVQVLFLDIDMPVVDGITFFKTLINRTLCVFITAYPDYAIEAFDMQALDYLLKPVKKERFEQALVRIKELIGIKAKALLYDTQIESETLTIKEGHNINKVLIDDIIYLEALANYTKVVTIEKKYITLINLKNFLEDLPQGKFLRIHRSYAVARSKINRLEHGEIVAGKYRLPLGKTYRQIINKLLN